MTPLSSMPRLSEMQDSSFVLLALLFTRAIEPNVRLLSPPAALEGLRYEHLVFCPFTSFSSQQHHLDARPHQFGSSLDPRTHALHSLPTLTLLSTLTPPRMFSSLVAVDERHGSDDLAKLRYIALR